MSIEPGRVKRILGGGRLVVIECDVCIVGAGIAGAGLAARLAARRSVVLAEREDQPGFHATGRSVAIFTQVLPGAQVGVLTRASRDFFLAPPDGFATAPLMRPRPVLQFGGTDQLAALDALYEAQRSMGGDVRWLEGEAVLARAPILRPGHAAAAVLDGDAFDLDVDGLLQGWLRMLRTAGGRLLTGASLVAAEPIARGWRLRAGDHDIQARVLVNAAGAWGDQVACLAGARGLGLEPRRRTVAVLNAGDRPTASWPMCVEAGHGLYFKPESGRLLVSAMEETPSPPCDAFADDMDVAWALDRFETVTTLPLRRPLRTWAGLRTFAPDNEPVAGYDPGAPGFFWLVGQGGAGIQTCPALSEAAAALVLNEPLPAALADHGVSAALLSPTRFRTGRAAD